MSDERMPRDTINDVDYGHVKPPPRLLLWAIVGLFVLALLGGISAVILFRNVLLPAQQQRVIDQLPFMRQFMAPTPEGGTLPTPLPNEGDISPEQLLAAPLVRPSITPTPTEAATEVPTATESIEVAASPTTAPTDSASPTPTATEPPPTLVPASQSNTSSQIGVQTVSLPASARMYGFHPVEADLEQLWPGQPDSGAQLLRLDARSKLRRQLSEAKSGRQERQSLGDGPVRQRTDAASRR